MIRRHVEHLINKTSARFIIGFALVVIIAMTLTFLVGEYVEDEFVAAPTCPRGEIC